MELRGRENVRVETKLGERGLGQFERVMVGCGGKEAAGTGFKDDTGVGGKELDTALLGVVMATSIQSCPSSTMRAMRVPISTPAKLSAINILATRP